MGFRTAIGVPLDLHLLTFHTRVNASQTVQKYVFVLGRKQSLNVIFELVPFCVFSHIEFTHNQLCLHCMIKVSLQTETLTQCSGTDYRLDPTSRK